MAKHTMAEKQETETSTAEEGLNGWHRQHRKAHCMLIIITA